MGASNPPSFFDRHRLAYEVFKPICPEGRMSSRFLCDGYVRCPSFPIFFIYWCRYHHAFYYLILLYINPPVTSVLLQGTSVNQGECKFSPVPSIFLLVLAEWGSLHGSCPLNLNASAVQGQHWCWCVSRLPTCQSRLTSPKGIKTKEISTRSEHYQAINLWWGTKLTPKF